MTSPQRAFDFPPLITPGADNFVEGVSSQKARALLAEPTRWPQGALLMHGPAHSGKSHLASIFAPSQGAEMWSGPTLTLDQVMGRTSPAVVDDADRTGDERALFQLLEQSRLGEAGPLLLVARTPGHHWPVRLPDLVSRLAGLTQITIEAPDDTELGAIFSALMARWGVEIDEQLTRYVLTRIERNHQALYEFARRLNQFALEENRRVTAHLVYELWND